MLNLNNVTIIDENVTLVESKNEIDKYEYNLTDFTVVYEIDDINVVCTCEEIYDNIKSHRGYEMQIDSIHKNNVGEIAYEDWGDLFSDKEIIEIVDDAECYARQQLEDLIDENF